VTQAWLREEQPALATEKILDAAEKAFVERGVSAAGMAEIAEAAGCSRGTLYRYFGSRHELHVAYVERAACRILHSIRTESASLEDPEARLVECILHALRLVRQNPGTAAWFAPGVSDLAARMSRTAEVVEPLTVAFAATLAGGKRAVDRQLAARWAVRIIMSFLADPGEDETEERALLERFVAPGLAGHREN
jgi:AcrR family transcriptional regulator